MAKTDRVYGPQSDFDQDRLRELKELPRDVDDDDPEAIPPVINRKPSAEAGWED